MIGFAHGGQNRSAKQGDAVAKSNGPDDKVSAEYDRLQRTRRDIVEAGGDTTEVDAEIQVLAEKNSLGEGGFLPEDENGDPL